jgi:hypothetical protein
MCKEFFTTSKISCRGGVLLGKSTSILISIYSNLGCEKDAYKSLSKYIILVSIINTFKLISRGKHNDILVGVKGLLISFLGINFNISKFLCNL